MANTITIIISNCTLFYPDGNPGGHGSHSKHDRYIWDNQDDTYREVVFDKKTPADLFVDVKFPIVIPAKSKTLALELTDDAKHEGIQHYSVNPCDPFIGGPGPHVIVVDA